ncbi:MAG: phenylalanine--tRNA ligase subunit beta [Chloroflexi bacterium]|nr:phenylalanine--tRNA ligase subunit beta [Chloroflexota bacterium]
MKISLRWLKEYVDITLAPPELAQRLTASGNEVNSVETVGEAWEHVVVGRIAALERHPQADRLLLATVDLGGESLTVVTGAPNLQVGQKAPFARVGARLIDGHTGKPMTLKPARVRGVLSDGMVCSEKELGLSDDHETIMILDAEAPVGVPLADYLGDTILDLKVTPNRPDCLSHLGVAWEVAALTEGKVRWPPLDYAEAGPLMESWASVEITDPDLCPRYCASLVQGVKVGPSPRWMQESLKAAGMRPINNIVDVTNYVMLEYGQPLHAFDFDRLRGGKIIVRRARPGERLTALDGSERALLPEMLVIADAERAVALAGVMGGQDAEVRVDTVNILLESANFHPTSIRRTATSLRMPTEASLRFEKGMSPELPLPALRRATRLLVELGGGVAAQGILDSYPGRREREAIAFTPEDLRRVLGLELSPGEITGVLERLGFAWQRDGDSIQALPPYWRMDVTLVEDVAEEVSRILGYEAIPTTLPSGHLPRYEPSPLLELKERVQDLLAASGLQEVINYSLVSGHSLESVAAGPTPLKVANPLTSEQEYLRTSLRPSLLSTLAANERHQRGGIRIFEVGRVYLRREEDLPQEREVAAGAIAGPRQEPSWLGGDEMVDFYDAKGAVESLLSGLGLEAEFEPVEDPDLVPGQAAQIMFQGRALGVLGRVLPAVAARFDIASPAVYLFELELATLAEAAQRPVPIQPLPRFPGVLRDIALVVAESVSHAQVKAIIASSPLVAEVSLFDVYVGAPVPPGHKSLAYRVVYRAAERTLTDSEAALEEQKILSRLERELGAQLRAS